ncbi:venom protease-like [Hyposmocoma kahamanoa]|uniref:venom protease-like n=1 Tax=Hyposmocoma kahamanoa TaxID=1477025 RepID=UPI000E6D946A|nr:venom protease-like [Hyposmocoma kahamanoa]
MASAAWLILLLVGVVVAIRVDRSEYRDLSWNTSLIDAHVDGNRMKRQSSNDDAQMKCSTPDGRQGTCRHLRYCSQQVYNNDFVKFVNYLCVLSDKSIGACCPIQENSFAPEALAGELPATAPQEENNEALIRIERAENRGCGVSTRATGRLVGARPANIRDWPWMASVTPEGFSQYCGGVLITDRHVLTAAHCTRRWKADELFVTLGDYDLVRSNDSRSYSFKVIEKRQHEYYEVPNYHHDIAILKLHRPAVFNTYVWPICLPPPGMSLTNETAVVIGWGTKMYGGPHSNVLMEVGVPVWDHEKCVNSFVDSVFNETLCAGGYEGGKDACQGDSGGPLMYQMSSGRWAVIGVVSWGIRCGEASHPGLYARVDRYLRWIIDNAQF